VSRVSPACAGAGSCCWRSRAAGRRRSSRPLLALPGSPSPACRLGSGSPSWRSAPSAPTSRLVPVATPCQFAAPRMALPRICRGQARRGAPLPSEPRQRGPAARRCLAAAPLSSSGSGLLPSLRWGRLLAQRFSPSRLPHGWALLWPRLTPPRPSDAVADTLLRFARRAEEVSHGKTLHFLGATPTGQARGLKAHGFTRARDRRSIGRPRPSPGCPTALALYPVPVRRLPDLPPASSPPRIAATQLPLAIGSAPCGPKRTCTSKFNAMRGTQWIPAFVGKATKNTRQFRFFHSLSA
jgi:hypothetical protein